MDKKRLIGLFFIFLGMSLVLGDIKVTGAVIGGGFFSSLGVVGVLSFVLGGMLVFMGERPGIMKYSLEDIFKDETSNKFRKSATYLGKAHIKRGSGDLPPRTKFPKETDEELFKLLELEKNQHLKLPNAPSFQMRYGRHKLSGGIPELELGDGVVTYDAKTLSTGHRGKFRYVFEKGKYLGLAQHSKSSAGQVYKWAS